MLYNLLRDIARIIFKLFFRLDIVGEEFVPKKGAFILASNHLSNLDPVVLGVASFRRLNFLAKEELFQVTLLQQFLSKVGAFPLKRGRADIFALKESLRRLKRQEPLLVFPEGTRIAKMTKVYPGVGFLVRKAGVPVVPVRIYNTDKILPPGKVFPKLKKIRVVFGKPVVFDKDKNSEDIAKEVIQRIRTL